MINIKDITKPMGSQSFLIGIGVAAVAYFLAPQLKQSLRPTAVKGAQGVMTLGSKTKEMFEEGKEKLSNLFSEKVEGAREMFMGADGEAVISSDVLKEIREDRKATNDIIGELKDSIISLKEEISNMKKGEDLL